MPDLWVSIARFPSPESRKRWLFEFLRIDLTTLTPGQLLGMRKDAWGFVDTGLAAVVELTAKGGLEPDKLPSVSALKQLQEGLGAGIKTLQSGRWWVLERPTKYGIAVMGDGIIRGHHQGAFQDLFLAGALDVVQDSWKELYECPRCKHIFLKSGKQKYCSPACSQKTRWERFKSHRGARDHRDEREQALGKRLGPKAKVKLGRRRG